MTVPYAPNISVLGYVLSPDREHVLLVHRNARPNDQHYGKYNGLGGKLERDEDVVAGLRRELREEADIEVVDVRFRGTVSWPGFGLGGEDWFGFIFVVDTFTGSVPPSNAEGDLEWVPVADIGTLPRWEGDDHILPLIFDDSVGQFHGVLPYVDAVPQSWSVTILPTQG